jgi:Uma2 family endonuclease
VELVDRRGHEHPRRLEVYEDPMPLVAEVWSPSTGDYDVEVKLREYQLRQDREIWRIHPYEQTLTAWRRQPDGTYSEAVYTSGSVQPVALPNVTIPLADLFE